MQSARDAVVQSAWAVAGIERGRFSSLKALARELFAEILYVLSFDQPISALAV